MGLILHINRLSFGSQHGKVKKLIIPVAIMAVLLLASGAVWCFVFTGRIPQPECEDLSQERAPELNYPALALVLYLFAMSVVTLIHTRGRAPSPDDLTVERLQTHSAEKMFFLALLVASFFLIPHLSLKDYGVRFQKWLKQLAVGGLAFLASWLPVFLLLLATSPLRTEETLHPFLQLIHEDQSGETLVWIGVAVVLVAPFWEEFAYRVILQTSLSRWMPNAAAIGLTAVLFCAVHGWPDMIPLLPLALVLGAVYHYYRSYLAVVAAHALFNAAMLVMALVSLNLKASAESADPALTGPWFSHLPWQGLLETAASICDLLPAP